MNQFSASHVTFTVRHHPSPLTPPLYQDRATFCPFDNLREASSASSYSSLNYQGTAGLLDSPSDVWSSTFNGPTHHHATTTLNSCRCRGLQCQATRTGCLSSLLSIPSGSLSSRGSHHVSPSAISQITVELQQEDLWTQFQTVGTEMVLTKAGR